MNEDTELMVGVWEVIKTYVSKKDRSEIPHALLRVFDELCDMDGIEDNLSLFDSELKDAIVDFYEIGDDLDDDHVDW